MTYDQCLGQNFAYNEASFFIIRLLQRVRSFELATDVQPEGTTPPLRWKDGKGRQAFEQVWPWSNVTAFIKVRMITLVCLVLFLKPLIGWFLDPGNGCVIQS